MPSKPSWRTSATKTSGPGHKNANWALELHRPSWGDPRIPKCSRIIGEGADRRQCGSPAIRGATLCFKHGGTRHLDKIIASGRSRRIYAETNPRSNSAQKGEHTTKCDVATHIHTRKQLSAASDRLQQSKWPSENDASNSVRAIIQNLSLAKRTRLFLLWEGKNLDPRSYNLAIRKLMHEH